MAIRNSNSNSSSQIVVAVTIQVAVVTLRQKFSEITPRKIGRMWLNSSVPRPSFFNLLNEHNNKIDRNN